MVTLLPPAGAAGAGAAGAGAAGAGALGAGADGAGADGAGAAGVGSSALLHANANTAIAANATTYHFLKPLLRLTRSPFK